MTVTNKVWICVYGRYEDSGTTNIKSKKILGLDIRHAYDKISEMKAKGENVLSIIYMGEHEEPEKVLA